VPRKALTYMVYSMDEIDAQAALQLGFISIVVPLAGLDAALDKLLAATTARSPEALIAVKDYFRVAPYMEPRGAADYGANLLAGVLSSAGK
jgi:enoyl-CoA hydratase/carnithine racemase